MKRIDSLAIAAIGALAWLVGTGVVGATGCDDAPACYPGDFEACLCGDERGFAECLDGNYGACTCDGSVPGLVTNDGGGGGGLLPLWAPCKGEELADECESGECQNYPAKGGFLCTLTCAEGCPPESGGCNMKGFCKAP